MKTPFRHVLFLAVLPFCLQVSSFAQNIKVALAETKDGQGGYFAQWDAEQQKLLLYRDVTLPSVPAARIYSGDGSSIALFPVRDLESSWYADVYAIGATPDGGAVLACGIGYTPTNVKPAEVKTMLLTYDGTGKLRRAWDVWPYQYFNVAVDKHGNVFGLGMREGESPYPLIVKYSPSGKVLREFFSTSLMTDGDFALHTKNPDGENEMLIVNDSLFVWLAHPQELFRFSLNGDLIARMELAGPLKELSTANNGAGTTLLQISTNESGETIAEVAVRSTNPKTQRPSLLLVRIVPDGKIHPLESISSTGRFLWAGHNDKNIYLEYDPASKISTVNEH